MCKNLIFTYMIDSTKVSVYKHKFQKESSFDIEEFFCGTYLLAGEMIDQCPEKDIFELYNKLRCPKKFEVLNDRGHGYTEEFKENAFRWFSCNIRKDKIGDKYE